MVQIVVFYNGMIRLRNVTTYVVIFRRELQMEGVQQCTLEEALQNPDVHVILICTENDQHEPTAR